MTYTDSDTLDAIAALMNDSEWDSEMMSNIAEMIMLSGRTINYDFTEYPN